MASKNVVYTSHRIQGQGMRFPVKIRNRYYSTKLHINSHHLCILQELRTPKAYIA